MEKNSLIQNLKEKFGFKSIVFKSGASECFDFLLSKYNFKKGSEVIVPVSLCISMIEVIIQHNLIPVFVDIDENFFINITPNLITDKTKLIVFVNQYGYVNSIKDLNIYNTKGEKVICVLDNAQCFLSEFNSGYDAILYSFNKNKPVSVSGGLGLMALKNKGQDNFDDVLKEQVFELTSKINNFDISSKNQIVQNITSNISIKNSVVKKLNNSYYRFVMALNDFNRVTFGRFENELYELQRKNNLKIVQTTIDIAPFQSQKVKKYLKKMGKPLYYQKQFPIYNKLASSAIYFIIDKTIPQDKYNLVISFINNYKNNSTNKI